MPYRKIIAIPDLQVPDHDERAVLTATKIVKGEKPDVIIHIGDFVDLASLSRYKKKLWREAKLTADVELEMANKVLDCFDKVTPAKTKVIFLEGNHEVRLRQYFLDHAEKLGGNFKGISIEEQLFLKERKYKFFPILEQPHYIGKLGFIHGWYVNQYHANATAAKSHRSILYGHTHDHQVMTGYHMPDEAPIMAMSLGCLCRYDLPHMQGKPSNWAQGVGVITIDDKTGFFWVNYVQIIKGQAVINGKTYKS